MKLAVLQHFTKSFKRSSSEEPSSHKSLETSKLQPTENAGPSSSTYKEPAIVLGNSNSQQEYKELQPTTKMALSSVGSQFEDSKDEEIVRSNSKKYLEVEEKGSLKVTKSAQSSSENNINISKSSSNLLHPQILRASPWLKTTTDEEKPVLTASISDKPVLASSISNPSTTTATTNKVADEQSNQATTARKSRQKNSNWSRLFSNIKDKQSTASKQADAPKFKLSGIKLGGMRSSQGLEASDNWEKDKIKNPERFSDLHRVVFEKVKSLFLHTRNLYNEHLNLVLKYKITFGISVLVL
jgi:hypothetical protein